MKQEDKQLLLTDLCARLPYDVLVLNKDGDVESFTWQELKEFGDDYISKPYLRPTSSMTEEEKEELLSLMKEETKEMIELMRNNNFGVLKGKYHFNCLKELNWLLKNHFDFNGLIPKGLAIAVTEENNPYEN